MTPQARPVVFDQAAGCYDQTRTLPAATAQAQTAQLTEQLTGTGGPAGPPVPVLEIGVGTGRIAVPLAVAGLRVLGVDLSAPMLGRLAAKDSPVAAAVATATRLPLRDRSVGAVIACHVLNLIPDWQAAVSEAVRVLRPGGLLLATRSRGTDATAAQLRRRFLAAAGEPDSTVGLDDLDDLDQFLGERGALTRHLPPIPNPATTTAAQYLGRLRDNTYSYTWAIPDAARLNAVRAVTAWVISELGDPDRVTMAAGPVRWRSYRLP